jgi:hypothetical protein
MPTNPKAYMKRQNLLDLLARVDYLFASLDG